MKTNKIEMSFTDEFDLRFLSHFAHIETRKTLDIDHSQLNELNQMVSSHFHILSTSRAPTSPQLSAPRRKHRQMSKNKLITAFVSLAHSLIHFYRIAIGFKQFAAKQIVAK